MPADAIPLSPAQIMKRARALKSDESARAGLQRVRLVLLASYTTTLLEPTLMVEGERQGLYLDIHHGGFGQFEQELLGDAWRAEDGTPESLVVAMRVEDLFPDVGLRDSADFARGREVVLERVDATLALFRRRSRGMALVANFALPEPRVAQLFDANIPESLLYEMQALNRELVTRVAAHGSCHVWDYAGLVASAGSATWTDPRMWALSRTPVAASKQPLFAAHLARTLRAALKPRAKCLVLDLDNTLWGGVIGDDGLGGIQLGSEHPGSAFRALQRAALGLRDRGVLLALASKNDLHVVLEALEKHPEMLVKASDFACMRISWEPKSKSLREIAEALNIGLDSLVFFDDNPVERAEVAAAVPEVLVVDVPTDPALYVQALANVPVFDAPVLTAEDRARAEDYQAQAERDQAERSAGSIESFLASLRMVADIEPWNALNAQRITQLVGKTNQFNTTTQRWTEAELAGLHTSGAGVFALRLRDTYGDMGLVGVLVLTGGARGEELVVHGLILSCRVANRGIEQTMVAFAAEVARQRECTALVGDFIPTKKNGPVAELYPRLGFTPLAASDDGVTRYRRALEGANGTEPLAYPAWVQVDIHDVR